MFKSPIALLTLVAAAIAVSPAVAQENAKKTVEDQKVCPIMTKDEVNADSPVVEYHGVPIRLCCDVCAKKFEENPEPYLNKEFLPQLNDMEVPARKIKQMFCPVYKERVITDKDLSVEYKGKKVYLFNKAALKKWEKNPEKYADPKILPQLLEDESTSDKSPPDSDKKAG
jgi:YHS domain-containing protein